MSVTIRLNFRSRLLLPGQGFTDNGAAAQTCRQIRSFHGSHGWPQAEFAEAPQHLDVIIEAQFAQAIPCDLAGRVVAQKPLAFLLHRDCLRISGLFLQVLGGSPMDRRRVLRSRSVRPARPAKKMAMTERTPSWPQGGNRGGGALRS